MAADDVRTRTHARAGKSHHEQSGKDNQQASRRYRQLRWIQTKTSAESDRTKPREYRHFVNSFCQPRRSAVHDIPDPPVSTGQPAQTRQEGGRDTRTCPEPEAPSPPSSQCSSKSISSSRKHLSYDHGAHILTVAGPYDVALGKRDPFASLAVPWGETAIASFQLYLSLPDKQESTCPIACSPIDDLFTVSRKHWISLCLPDAATTCALVAYIHSNSYNDRERLSSNLANYGNSVALRSIKDKLAKPSPSWNVFMIIVLLGIMAVQVGDKAAEQAHAAGLLALLRQKHSIPLQQTCDCCRRPIATATRAGLHEMYVCGLLDRRIAQDDSSRWFSPEMLASTLKEPLLATCLMQHFLMASLMRGPLQTGGLQHILSKIWVYCFRMCVFWALKPGVGPIADSFVYYNLQLVEDVGALKAGSFADTAFLQTWMLHPGFHLWMALVCGSFVTDEMSKKNLTMLLRMCCERLNLASVDVAIAYVEQAFHSAPPMHVKMKAFWNEAMALPLNR